jgi:hypothetical protein
MSLFRAVQSLNGCRYASYYEYRHLKLFIPVRQLENYDDQQPGAFSKSDDIERLCPKGGLS